MVGLASATAVVVTVTGGGWRPQRCEGCGRFCIDAIDPIVGGVCEGYLHLGLRVCGDCYDDLTSYCESYGERWSRERAMAWLRMTARQQPQRDPMAPDLMTMLGLGGAR